MLERGELELALDLDLRSATQAAERIDEQRERLVPRRRQRPRTERRVVLWSRGDRATEIRESLGEVSLSSLCVPPFAATASASCSMPAVFESHQLRHRRRRLSWRSPPRRGCASPGCGCRASALRRHRRRPSVPDRPTRRKLEVAGCRSEAGPSALSAARWDDTRRVPRRRVCVSSRASFEQRSKCV